MQYKLLITGATGNVGKATIEQLLTRYQNQVEVYAAVTDENKARQQLPFPALRFVPFRFEEPESVRKSLQSMDKVFLLRPPQISDVDKHIRPVIQVAKEANIAQIVFLSLQGVENNSFTPHYKIEKLIRAEGIPFTMLRPSFFMQNLTTTHRQEIAERNEIFIPAGKGKTNFVDVRDIGEVAAQVLSSEDHLNQAYELTGSDAFDYYQIAEILSRTLGRTITYRDPSVVSFILRKWREGTPLSFALVMVALYTVAKLGKAAGYAQDLERLLGRKPVSFEQFARHYRSEWSYLK